MINNVGKKIKITALVIAFVIIVIGVVIVARFDQEPDWIKYVILFATICCAWLCICTFYGFGEIVDKITQIAENTKPTISKTENNANLEHQEDMQDILQNNETDIKQSK